MDFKRINFKILLGSVEVPTMGLNMNRCKTGVCTVFFLLILLSKHQVFERNTLFLKNIITSYCQCKFFLGIEIGLSDIMLLTRVYIIPPLLWIRVKDPLSCYRDSQVSEYIIIQNAGYQVPPPEMIQKIW